MWSEGGRDRRLAFTANLRFAPVPTISPLRDGEGGKNFQSADYEGDRLESAAGLEMAMRIAELEQCEGNDSQYDTSDKVLGPDRPAGPPIEGPRRYGSHSPADDCVKGGGSKHDRG